MGYKIRILYAEDDPLGAALTKKILEKHDFLVEIAPDGAKAWEAYKRQRPDILLLDLDMPKKDGLEITRLVREQDSKTHIIVYTSHGKPEKEVAVLDAGADEFISKDREAEVLVAHLKRVCQKMVANTNFPHLYQLSADTTYNSISRLLTIRDESTQLKSVDGRFLQLLCAKNHEIAGREYLIQGVWGKADTSKESELKKYASRVRSYLKADSSLQIECRGGGYILFSTEEQSREMISIDRKA